MEQAAGHRLPARNRRSRKTPVGRLTNSCPEGGDSWYVARSRMSSDTRRMVLPDGGTGSGARNNAAIEIPAGNLQLARQRYAAIQVVDETLALWSGGSPRQTRGYGADRGTRSNPGRAGGRVPHRQQQAEDDEERPLKSLCKAFMGRPSANTAGMIDRAAPEYRPER